jgi:hypothetical protein
MQMYAKAMYQAWCNGQDQMLIRSRYKVFIALASRNLSRSLDDMEQFLRTQSWFLKPEDDCTSSIEHGTIYK